MPRTPNYDFERKERDRAKAAKKAEKLAARTAKRDTDQVDEVNPETDGELGSGLIDQSQKITAAAMQMAEKKVWAHRS